MNYIPTFGDNSAMLNENPLAPIYRKVKELTLQKKNKEQENEAKSVKKEIVQLQTKNVGINIDRGHQFIQRRIEGLSTLQVNYEPTSTKKQNNENTTKNTNFPKLKNQRRSKSERVINFLRVSSDKKSELKKPQTPDFIQNAEEPQRQIFTPMRPISRISGYPDSISITSKSMKSRSQNRSSGGYSQTARLSQKLSSKSSSTGQYLRKGHRMRQNLKKQLQNPSGIEQQGELAYLREYDQWVPSNFLNKKMELDHFMNILVGGKKIEEKSNHVFQPIYL